MTDARSPRYRAAAIVLHWAIAALILVQVALGLRMGEARSPEAFAVFQLHKSVGITILLLSLARLGLRLAFPPPALPAAYAFSRYRFLGDKHLFFWLLTNRMAPPAVFALPFYQLYSAVGLFDTPWAVALAHTLFNIPLAVWILEGFMSGVPKELDETAYVDGYSFWRFFIRIFMPTIAAGIGVACFFCFMFSWVELLLAKTLTSVAAKPIAALMTKTASTSGYELGLLAAAGSLTLVPGAVVIYFVRNYIAKGFALGRV